MRCTTKILCTITALMMVTGMAYGDRQTLDPTLTNVALPLPEAPTIDGSIETEVWQYAGGSQAGGGSSDWSIEFNEFAIDFVVGGQNPNTSTGGPLSADDINIEIFAGYTEEALYVAVRVQDDLLFSDTAEAESQNQNTWQDDSVEVFVDGDNSNFEERDTTGENPEVVDTGGQYVITVNNAFREAEAGNPGYGPDQPWYALTQVDEDAADYEAEFRISMDEIGNPQQGDIIGFTVQVNDDDDGGDSAENVYIWTGASHEEVTYGNLVLGPRSYTAPKVSSAPTIDGEVSDGEYGDAEAVEVNTHTGMYTGVDNDWEEGDHAFTFQVVHDDENIYVRSVVSDDQIKIDTSDPATPDGNTWQDDSVEAFFDGDNSDDTVHFNNAEHGPDEFEGQYVMTAHGARRDNEANNPPFGEDAQWFAAQTMGENEYTVELRIGKAGLLNPADGDTVGFNININDDDDNIFGNEPKTQLNWSGRPHLESSYGDLILGTGGTPVSHWNLY